MANRIYKAAMVGIIGIIVAGTILALQGYSEDIYPVDRMRGHLNGILRSSDTAVIQSHLNAIDTDITKVLDKIPNGNPVWIFPTITTDLNSIQVDLKHMRTSLAVAETLPLDSSAYHVAMMDINGRADTMQKNLIEAIPYLYVNFSNVVFATVWITAIIAIFAILKKRRDKLTSIDKSGT